MQKTKSLLLKILMFVMVACFSFVSIFSMTGCFKDDDVSIQSAQINAEGELEITLTNGKVIIAGKVKGDKGEQGPQGEKGDQGVSGILSTVEISADGYWVIDGQKTEHKAIGVNGNDGTDGVTPVIEIIGGYWYINGENTNIKAEGTDGKDGQDGKDGKDGQDGINGTNGKDGQDGQDGQDGNTPQLKIGEDNYWYVSYDNGTNWESLNVKASGEDGKDGQDILKCAHINTKDIDTKKYYYTSLEVESEKCGFKLVICLDCKVCVAVEFDHELEETDEKQPTCTEYGFHEGKHCVNCTYADAGSIAPTGHINMEDLEFNEIEENLGLNKCVDTWYTGKVCTDCGYSELTPQDPVGHTYIDIHVEQFATLQDKAILHANCSICGERDLEVVKLPSVSEENDYIVTVIAATQSDHTVKYTVMYDGVEYIVQPVLVVNHENTVITDYTPEKYPNIIFKIGEPDVNSETFVNGGYICDVCNRWVDCSVKAAPTSTEPGLE